MTHRHPEGAGEHQSKLNLTDCSSLPHSLLDRSHISYRATGYGICFGEESKVEGDRASCPDHAVGVATDSVTSPKSCV